MFFLNIHKSKNIHLTVTKSGMVNWNDMFNVIKKLLSFMKKRTLHRVSLPITIIIYSSIRGSSVVEWTKALDYTFANSGNPRSTPACDQLFFKFKFYVIRW